MAVKAVKKSFVWVVLVLSVLAIVYSASPAAAALSPLTALNTEKIKNVGQDSRKMQWYVVEYGAQEGVPFAAARLYYTNAEVKKQTIDLLISQYGIDPAVAGALYFTEYGYEYTPDGKQFSVAYIAHGSMNTAADFIHVTQPEKKWNAVRDSFAANKAVPFVFPRR